MGRLITSPFLWYSLDMSKASREFKSWAKRHPIIVGKNRKLRTLREYRACKRRFDKIEKETERSAHRIQSMKKVNEIAIRRCMEANPSAW